MAIGEERQRVGWGRGGLTPQCQHGDEEKAGWVPSTGEASLGMSPSSSEPFLPCPHLPVSSPVSPWPRPLAL